MPAVIDPETISADNLPPVWSPVQWELTDEERITELEEQATASLLWVSDAPQAILRLLLGETAIGRAFEAPPGFDPEQQGEWDDKILTFEFDRPIELLRSERSPDRLYLEYKVADHGYWAFEIEAEEVRITRL